MKGLFVSGELKGAHLPQSPRSEAHGTSKAKQPSGCLFIFARRVRLRLARRGEVLQALFCCHLRYWADFAFAGDLANSGCWDTLRTPVKLHTGGFRAKSGVISGVI